MLINHDGEIKMNNVATIEFDNGRYRAMFNGKTLASSRNRDYVVDSIKSGKNRKAVENSVFDVVDSDVGESNVISPLTPVATNVKNLFSIDERFSFLSNMVQMVIDGVVPSLIISGEGGLGKTHNVLTEIRNAKLTFTTEYQEPVFDEEDEEDEDKKEPVEWKNPGEVHVIKGYSTAKGLYRTLFENNGCLMIFDDCDSIQKDQTAINILKSALDSYDERWISWNAESFGKDSLPRRFLFTGKIIFISNLPQTKIDQAIKSRCLRVDLTMNSIEKIERMFTIINDDKFLPNYDMSIKTESLDFLNANRDIATDLNIRTLMAVCHIRAANKPNWNKLALYTITA